MLYSTGNVFVLQYTTGKDSSSNWQVSCDNATITRRLQTRQIVQRPNIHIAPNNRKKVTAWQRPTIMHLIDFTKAFDCIHRPSLWCILKKIWLTSWSYYHHSEFVQWRAQCSEMLSRPVLTYTACWQRHMCVNNLPRSLPGWSVDQQVVTWLSAGSQTHDLSIASPTPLHHKATSKLQNTHTDNDTSGSLLHYQYPDTLAVLCYIISTLTLVVLCYIISALTH